VAQSFLGMSQNIKLFEFSHEDKNFILRSIEIDGEHWYVANDICKALGIKQTRNAANRLDHDDVRKTDVIDSIGRIQKTNIVNESGLYALIFQSNKSIAKRFKRWVTKEILPQIRKTGSYGTSNHSFVERYNANWKNIKSGYFSVISELYVRLYGKFEMYGHLISEEAFDGTQIRPDTSVGKLFAKYLENYYPSLEIDFKYYKHLFPKSKIVVRARQYPNFILPLFIEYLENHWIPDRAYSYFRHRDPKALEYIPKLLPNKAV